MGGGVGTSPGVIGGGLGRNAGAIGGGVGLSTGVIGGGIGWNRAPTLSAPPFTPLSFVAGRSFDADRLLRRFAGLFIAGLLARSMWPRLGRSAHGSYSDSEPGAGAWR